MENLLGWRPNGNAFLGPSVEQRGPLDPMASIHQRSSIYAFEFDCEQIIGHENYVEMLAIYRRLIEYVHADPTTSTDHERSLSGSEIITWMILIFVGHSIEPVNIDQWEFRELTESELERIPMAIRQNFRGQKFWAIRKNQGRLKRSVMQKYVQEDKCYDSEDYAKERWSEFIVSTMKTVLRPRTNKYEPNSWSCDFMRSYFSYQFIQNSNDCLNSNFDTFLLSRISHGGEWTECVNYNVDRPKDWCVIWRRIMVDSFDWKKLKTQDLEVLMHWVWEKTSSQGGQQEPRNQSFDKNHFCYNNETFHVQSEANYVIRILSYKTQRLTHLLTKTDGTTLVRVSLKICCSGDQVVTSSLDHAYVEEVHFGQLLDVIVKKVWKDLNMTASPSSVNNITEIC